MMFIQLTSHMPMYRARRRGGFGGVFTTSNAPTIYDGQNLSFYCYASDYVFSEGIRWAIKWKNNTLQVKGT